MAGARSPRLRTLIVGRYSDDWLNESVRIRAWPQSPRPGHRAPRSHSPYRFPRDWNRTVDMKIGRHATFVIRPGSKHRVVCWNATGPLDILASTEDVAVDEANRPLSVN